MSCSFSDPLGRLQCCLLRITHTGRLERRVTRLPAWLLTHRGGREVGEAPGCAILSDTEVALGCLLGWLAALCLSWLFVHTQYILAGPKRVSDAVGRRYFGFDLRWGLVTRAGEGRKQHTMHPATSQPIRHWFEARCTERLPWPRVLLASFVPWLSM